MDAPIKLFREEGKTGAIECPACGAPITLRGFGAIEQVACSYCGTVCKPEHDGTLDILQRAERQRLPSALPLHQRGTIDGITWEILGICWRQVVADGVAYPWQEFLLFNPYEGYRWLIYSMSDGVWSFGKALPGAVEQIPGARPRARYAGEEYQHFSSGEAEVIYVEGEFPWQVLAGDRAATNDYICPPKQISIEVEQTDHGADLNFTLVRPIAAAEVWAAFALPGSPPPTPGIHPAAVNPHKSKFYWVTGIILFALWMLAVIVYSAGREREQIFNVTMREGDLISEEIVIAGSPAPIDIELRAVGMNNSWAYAELLLVDVANEDAIALGLEVDYWSGVEGGESWTEGSLATSQVLGGVAAGTYLLQVNPQFDKGGKPADSLELTITRDVPLLRYIFLPLLFIIAFPAANLARRLLFEGKRWASSDYAIGSDDED